MSKIIISKKIDVSASGPEKAVHVLIGWFTE
jgi:hypothetical protein